MSLTDGLLADNRIIALMDELGDQLGPEDIQFLVHLLQQNRGAELEVLQDLMNYTYDHTPVGMREFIESPDYLGMKGQVFPVLLDDLGELFDSKRYNEAVLSGGIGWGKSTFAELALVRMVYEVACLRNPQKMYGLADNSVIAFVNVSVNLAQAKNVVFTGVKNKINSSPFFKKKFPYDASLKSEIRFPKDIWITPAASNEGGVIGLNVFGGVLDEVNFMDVVENSKQASDGGTYDQATQLHNAMIRRMKSRFLVRGKLPGILLSISSSKYPDDFTEKRMQRAIDNDEPDVFIRRYSQWDTKPPDRYSGVTFPLCLGDALIRPHIMETEKQRQEAVEKNLEVLHVPEEYEMDFKVDIDMAIRDIAGRPTMSIKPFIMQKEKIYDAIRQGEDTYGMSHPFSRDITNLQDGGAFLWDKFKGDKEKPHFLHIDLSLGGDGCGFAMTHVHDYKKVIRRNHKTGDTYAEVAPIVMLDIAMRIVAPKDQQVNIGDVRSLVYELRANGFNLQKVTFDQFQSADTIQQLNRAGILSENLSVDSKLDPYNAFRDALYEDRMLMYSYAPAIEEATRLEKNEKKDKVDHPPSGSKDVTDAIAGAVFHAVTSPVRGATIIEPGVMESQSPAERERRQKYEGRSMVDIYLDGDIDDETDNFLRRGDEDIYQYRSIYR